MKMEMNQTILLLPSSFFSAYQKLLWEWNEDGSQDADASAQPPSCFTEMLAVVTRDFVAHLRGLLPPW